MTASRETYAVKSGHTSTRGPSIAAVPSALRASLSASRPVSSSDSSEAATLPPALTAFVKIFIPAVWTVCRCYVISFNNCRRGLQFRWMRCSFYRHLQRPFSPSTGLSPCSASGSISNAADAATSPDKSRRSSGPSRESPQLAVRPRAAPSAALVV